MKAWTFSGREMCVALNASHDGFFGKPSLVSFRTHVFDAWNPFNFLQQMYLGRCVSYDIGFYL